MNTYSVPGTMPRFHLVPLFRHLISCVFLSLSHLVATAVLHGRSCHPDFTVENPHPASLPLWVSPASQPWVFSASFHVEQWLRSCNQVYACGYALASWGLNSSQPDVCGSGYLSSQPLFPCEMVCWIALTVHLTHMGSGNLN